MTYEELKEEAKRQGYNLIKKRPYIKLLKCTCGESPRYWFGSETSTYRCPKCHKEVTVKHSSYRPQSLTNRDRAKEAWNNMIATLDLVREKNTSDNGTDEVTTN